MKTKEPQTAPVEKTEDRETLVSGLENPAKIAEAGAGTTPQLLAKLPESQDIQSMPFLKREKDGHERRGKRDAGKLMDGNACREEQRLLTTLKNAFGCNSFREGQEQAVRAILDGKDALVVMPTGGGKSLTYLLPGLLLPGLVIIVSPLLALMDDQVRRLQERHLPAIAFNSLLSPSQRNTILQELPVHSFPAYENLVSPPPSSSSSSTSSSASSFSSTSSSSSSQVSASSSGGSRFALPCLSASPSRKYKFLFVTPEQVTSPTFQRMLSQLEARRRDTGKGGGAEEPTADEEARNVRRSRGVALIAVDEAHCICTWGHDFRRSYRQVAKQKFPLNLSVLRTILPETPLLACTATATPAVCADIQTSLALRDAVHIGLSFDRKNIFYEVRLKRRLGARTEDDAVPDEDPAAAADEEEDWTLEDMAAEVATRHRGECGIIYCFKKATCESVATALRCRGIPAQAYHAGLSDKVRCELQRGWMEGNIRVLVATVAFGLGVDNPHVRFVFHHSLPKTMEGYYQESGRCGRDGRPAHALLYYSPRNFESLRYIMDYTFSQLKLYSSKGRKPNARTKKGAGNRQEGEGEEEPDSVEDQKARLEHMERRYQKDLQSLKEVRKYCEETGCRRACILKFFGETVVPRRGFAKPSGRRESSKDPSKKRHRDAAEESEATSCRSFNRAKTEEKLSVHSGSADTAFVSQGNRNVSDGESLVACVRKRAPSCSDRVGAGFSEVKLGNNQNGENLKKNLCSDESDGGACLDAWRCCDLCEESKEGKTNGGGLPGKGHLTSAPSASVLASLNSRGCTRVSSASRRAPRSFAGGGMAAVAGEDDGGVLARGTLEFEKDDSSGEESGGDSRWCGAAKSFTGATTLRTGSSWYTHTSVMPRGLMASARGKRSEHCRSAGTGASGGGRVVYHTSAGSAFCRQSGVTKGQGTPSLKSGRVTDAVRAKGLRAVMEELERQEQLAEEEEDEGKKSRFFRQKFAAVRRSSSEADTPASRSCPLPFRRPRPASLGPASRKTACGMPLSNQPARSLAFVRASALPRDPTKSGAVAAAPLKSGLYHPRGKG
ncbi:UNVERIFIED_CONTAM: ATP-dependent DNA helicase, RecQ family protein [Hammondia hammondi]|eukprot:XP_008883080.1 ATP-dependent DNA helicase, RecQ family protein [Hammondia hammondi]